MIPLRSPCIKLADIEPLAQVEPGPETLVIIKGQEDFPTDGQEPFVVTRIAVVFLGLQVGVDNGRFDGQFFQVFENRFQGDAGVGLLE